jgi:hypothetical protein
MSAVAEPVMSWAEWEKEQRAELREMRRESRELAERVGVVCCGTCDMDEECDVVQVARERNRTLSRKHEDPRTKH